MTPPMRPGETWATYRLDKFLGMLWIVTRSKTKYFLRDHVVMIDGQPVEDKAQYVREGQIITIDDDPITVVSQVTVCIHKPTGYVSSDTDEWGHLSYQHLLLDCPYRHMVHVAGRLDQDTTWLLIATSDGAFAHRIISPKTHCWKTYLVYVADALTPQMIEQLAWGVTLDDGTWTLPARAEQIGTHELKLSLREGKFHQVKRMLQAVWNTVLSLHRTHIGSVSCADIPEGSWIYMTPAQQDALSSCIAEKKE